MQPSNSEDKVEGSAYRPAENVAKTADSQPPNPGWTKGPTRQPTIRRGNDACGHTSIKPSTVGLRLAVGDDRGSKAADAVQE